jgi:hypothetical protein
VHFDADFLTPARIRTCFGFVGCFVLPGRGDAAIRARVNAPALTLEARDLVVRRLRVHDRRERHNRHERRHFELTFHFEL